jgi:oligopeptidase B
MPFTLPKAPPVAHKIPVRTQNHGVSLLDDYAWLRAKNWQEVIENPKKLPSEIGAYLKAENRYFAEAFKPLAGLCKRLRAEMRARIKEDDAEPALKHGDYLYYERYRKGDEYALLCRSPIQGGDEQILLDGAFEAENLDYFELGTTALSPDHRLLGWSADINGSESYTLNIRDCARLYDQDQLERTSGDLVWGADSTFFYYVELDHAQRPYRVMRHHVGAPQSDDVEMFCEAKSGWFVGISSTQDESHAIITIHDHETSETWLIDLRAANARPFCAFERQAGLEYEIEHHEERWIIRTNAGDAPDFKVLSLPFSALPGRTVDWAQAQVLVPETPGRMLLGVDILKDWLIWSDLGESGPRVIARHWISGAEKVFEPRSAIGDLAASIGLEYDSDILRVTFSSPNEPDITLDHVLSTGEETVLKRLEVPSGHDADRYIVERIFAPASDGARIPVTVLRLKTTKLDGTAPALLYGYGAYGHALEADFETDRLSLVDRGFLYAIAHVRGGMEKGFGWYRNGKREKKTNSFLDFLTVADFLVEQGYAAPRRIVAHGASAGGMLMGAIANMAGEKFAGIVAEVPFVDCLNTMLDASLPLTPPEWVEWGNPIEDKTAFETIRSYSPYDQISAKPYPPMLVIGGLTDPRVTYWEPAKFVAKLRATMISGGPILFHTHMGAGHGGASGRFEQLDDVARIYAFALSVVGMDETMA